MNYRLVLPFVLVFSACTSTKKATVPPSDGQLVIGGKLWSSVFQQRAAEYKALCIQAFNIARLRVDEAFLRRSTDQPARPMAIITDIDETFLDNSAYAVHQALQGKDYEAGSWAEWTSKAMADTLSGALGFFNYAAAHRIEIFYITNRDEKDKPGTLANLQRFHFPFADPAHLLVRTTTSGKEDRRKLVSSTHEIILLLGDNLSDFSLVFDKKSGDERDKQVSQLAAEFGKKFIVLPNANYGGWEEAIYENSRNWTASQKDSLVKANLKTY